MADMIALEVKQDVSVLNVLSYLPERDRDRGSEGEGKKGCYK